MSFISKLFKKRSYRIGFANLTEEQPFAVEVRAGVERAAQQADDISLVLADNKLDDQTALANADYLIAENVDLVVEYHVNESFNEKLMHKFRQADIPVIALDIPILGATFVGINNYESGYLGGQALAGWITENWDGQIDKLICLEDPRAGEVPAARMRGQRQGLETGIGYLLDEMVIHLDFENSIAGSKLRMLETLQNLSPDCHKLAVICLNDEAAIGALEAAEEQDCLHNIAVVGQGAGELGREMIRKYTELVGSVAFTPERYGEVLLVVARQILEGIPTSPAVHIKPVFINRENIDQYYPETTP